jgi:hypothetical protein
MKLNSGILLLCACLVLVAQARATDLPDACGKDAAKFDVTKKAGQPVPAAPAAGKAQIIFFEDGDFIATARFGMDGVWVGADKGNSYFAVDVSPGLHHLCGNLQGKGQFDLIPIRVEPGKVYFFAAQIVDVAEGGRTFAFVQLNDDQAAYRLKNWKQSTFKLKPEEH